MMLRIALEEELTEVLGRDLDGARGYRNGYKKRTVKRREKEVVLVASTLVWNVSMRC